MARTVLVARVCAALTLLGAALVYSITHLRLLDLGVFPDLSLEGMVGIAGVAAWVCILSGAAAFLLSALTRRSRRDDRWYGPLAASVVGIVLLLVAFYG